MIEVGVPSLQRLPVGERFRPFHVGSDHLGFDEYDIARQGLVSHHYTRVGGVFELRSIPFRYVWPAELDLMARLAGMTPARTLEHLDARAVHEHERAPRLGVGASGIRRGRPYRVGSCPSRSRWRGQTA